MTDNIDDLIRACQRLGRWEQAKVLAEMQQTLAAAAKSPSTCPHRSRVEVRGAVTDELLAYLCPDCDAQLPA